MQTACIEIQKRYDFVDKMFSNVHIFSPTNAIDSSIRQRFPSLSFFVDIVPRCKPNNVSVQDIDNDWRSLPYTTLPNEILSEIEVDVFWANLAISIG